ncbi:hypothetical protein [Nocardioides mangrovi]|uniref:FlgD Ig-like domain-containing protein n=1 Tax=Nocardioides mangrovi TaxID=2874580 RepID=A0ABS7UJH5_9ACTN|nr:hypothetical protein [Nocardioides mangrovi]MBZ5741037.1 hypothetical protein [Nocardioides mangrovi]
MHVRSVLLAAAVALAGLAVVPAAHADDTDLSAIPAPTVTWPDQTNIGGDNPPYVIHVEDTDDPAAADTQLGVGTDGLSRWIDSHGDTTLTLNTDYDGPLHIYRCAGWSSECVDTGVASPPVSIHGAFNLDLDVPDHLLGGSDDVLGVVVRGAPAGAYRFDWWIEESPSVGGSQIPVELTGEPATGSVSADVADLPEGTYHLIGRLRKHYDGYGDAFSLETRVQFQIDRTAPSVPDVVLSTDVIYPERDGYLDTTRLTARSSENHLHFEVLDRSGAVVYRSTEGFAKLFRSWRGVADDGTALEPGKYAVRLVVVDKAGNVATGRVATVAIREGRMVTRTKTFSVSAAGSMIDQSVGACSELRRPGSRGWQGSLGYATNVTCNRSTRQSIALSVHRMRLPAAVSYTKLALGAYGGAASSVPTSRLRLELFDPERGPQGAWANHGLGWHWLHSGRATHYLYGRHANLVYWRAYTGAGASYDIRTFSIRLTYQAIKV